MLGAKLDADLGDGNNNFNLMPDKLQALMESGTDGGEQWYESNSWGGGGHFKHQWVDVQAGENSEVDKFIIFGTGWCDFDTSEAGAAKVKKCNKVFWMVERFSAAAPLNGGLGKQQVNLGTFLDVGRVHQVVCLGRQRKTKATATTAAA